MLEGHLAEPAFVSKSRNFTPNLDPARAGVASHALTPQCLDPHYAPCSNLTSIDPLISTTSTTASGNHSFRILILRCGHLLYYCNNTFCNL